MLTVLTFTFLSPSVKKKMAIMGFQSDELQVLYHVQYNDIWLLFLAWL